MTPATPRRSTSGPPTYLLVHACQHRWHVRANEVYHRLTCGRVAGQTSRSARPPKNRAYEFPRTTAQASAKGSSSCWHDLAISVEGCHVDIVP